MTTKTAASVSGIYVGHPEARYFSVGRVGRDQLGDYAERKGIPFVWFPSGELSGGHEVRDIRSGDQHPADPDAWTPPAEDLRVRIVTKPGPAG